MGYELWVNPKHVSSSPSEQIHIPPKKSQKLFFQWDKELLVYQYYLIGFLPN